MCTLSHPCTIRVIAWTAKPLALVMELCKHDLRQYYDKRDTFGYDLTTAVTIMLHAAQAMFYLHSTGLIHRDLKSMNIMVAENMQGKVGDYGESRELDVNKTMTSTGTALWMAPEVSMSMRYDNKADCYSFGIILYEICERDLPFHDEEGINGIGLAVKVALKRKRPTVAESWNEGLKDLMQECWKHEPSERPAFSEIVRRLIGITEIISGTGSTTRFFKGTNDLGADTNDLDAMVTTQKEGKGG